MTILAVVAGGFWIAFASSWIRPMSFSADQMGMGFTRGFVFVGFADSQVTVESGSDSMKPEWPVWTFGIQGGPRIILGPSTSWRPSISDGTMMLSTRTPPKLTMYNLHVAFVPLWWPGVFFLLLGLLCWWRLSRLARPGCCPSCRYDLKGLAVPVCPECGNSVDMPLIAPHDAAAHAQH